MFPPEIAHKVVLFMIKYFYFLIPKPKILKSGLPVCVAAGLDKDCYAIASLFKMGFNAVEIGTIVPHKQDGNPKPRLFRLMNDKSIINKMGFPSLGYMVSYKRLLKFNKRKKPGQIVGVNIGRNFDGTIADYTFLMKQFHNHCDYIALNISSPNTPNLRDTFKAQYLESFLEIILSVKREACIKTPIYVKLSPDLDNDDLQRIYDSFCKFEIDGIIACNTTVKRPHGKYNEILGGLSGRLLKDRSVEMLDILTKINKNNLKIISVGGVSTAKDVKDRLDKGAYMVQVYSSLVFDI